MARSAWDAPNTMVATTMLTRKANSSHATVAGIPQGGTCGGFWLGPELMPEGSKRWRALRHQDGRARGGAALKVLVRLHRVLELVLLVDRNCDLAAADHLEQMLGDVEQV